MDALWNTGVIMFLSCGFFYLLLSFFSSPNLSGRRLDVYHTSTCGLRANLECTSEMCCAQLAGNAEAKKSPKNHHRGTITQLCPAISLQLRQVLTIGKKNLLHSNISPTYPHNMVNFSLQAPEICWRVWGTPANFNGFRVLAE